MPDKPQRIVIVVDEGDVQHIVCEGEPVPSFVVLRGAGMAECIVSHNPLFVAQHFDAADPQALFDAVGGRFRDGLIIPGRCTRCGCTEEQPCPGGCFWVDPDCTLFSHCAGETYGPQSVEEMQPVLDAARAEMATAIAANQTIKFELGPVEAMTLLGHVQLAARHPANIGASAALARRVAGGIELQLGAIGPGLKRLAAAGWEGQFDGIEVIFSEEEPE